MKNVGVHIRLDSRTLGRLYKHLETHYGEHKGLSLTVERAVREFLDRNNGNDLSQGIMPEIKRQEKLVKVELNEVGTDVEIRWDNLSKSEPLSLLATISKWENDLSGSNFYLSMPLNTAKLLQAKLNEILGAD